MLGEKFVNYYLENFKKQFYIEDFKSEPNNYTKPNQEYANFKDEYTLTIYEVKQTFPTMTMIQTVHKVFEKKLMRVKINQWEVQQIIIEIQHAIRGDQDQVGSSPIDETARSDKFGEMLKKYITNDAVQGGLPKVLDLFFNEALAIQFIQLDNDVIKRAYLELFKTLELCYQELYRLVEVFGSISRNVAVTNAAFEILETRSKTLESKRALFDLQKLQENF